MDASARLFVAQGFAATSTREIADIVGIRQASLYYHFSGKDEILEELLKRSVRPSLDKVEKIKKDIPPTTYETALYLLALVDFRTLANVPHNIGLLYALPDVATSDAYTGFRDARNELMAEYGDLGKKVAETQEHTTVSVPHLGEMLIQLVEVVISMRANGEDVDCDAANAIASSCLRLCGATEAQIAEAKPIAGELLPSFVDEPVSFAS